MRNLLESFRLPGESQQIARITETFASKYFATGPGKFRLRVSKTGMSLMIRRGHQNRGCCLRFGVFDHYAEYRLAQSSGPSKWKHLKR